MYCWEHPQKTRCWTWCLVVGDSAWRAPVISWWEDYMKEHPFDWRKVKADLDWQSLPHPWQSGSALALPDLFGRQGRVNPKETWVCNKSSCQKGRKILGVLRSGIPEQLNQFVNGQCGGKDWSLLTSGLSKPDVKSALSMSFQIPTKWAISLQVNWLIYCVIHHYVLYSLKVSLSPLKFIPETPNKGAIRLPGSLVT